ncbi:DEAD-box ATP-dependent RNA helicase 38-like [Bidens hawaiensis]|uniref:DEAD-box ATP-dependent RNA helicase 38-like n=1 Tax=Bidens hawaiensis TaxID=980011 RepID=UPI00404A29AD
MSCYKVNLGDEASKISVIRDKILMKTGQQQTIIYVNKRANSMRLCQALADYGYKVSTESAATPQHRDQIINDFKHGLINIIIVTSLIAIDFDHPQVNLVINYDLPVSVYNPTEPHIEVYLFRIRDKGAVFNLLCGDTDNMLMEKIEREVNYNVTEVSSWVTEDDYKNMLIEAGLKLKGLCIDS